MPNDALSVVSSQPLPDQSSQPKNGGLSVVSSQPLPPTTPLGNGFMGKVVGGMLDGADKHSQAEEDLAAARELNPDNATGAVGVTTGFTKGALETLKGVTHAAGDVVGKVVGVPNAGDEVVSKMFPTNLNLESTQPSQSVGKGIEDIAEFAAGDEALSGLAKATKIVDLAEKYPQVAKTLEAARKHPVLAKMITEAAKAATVGGTQGAVKGEAHGDALQEAEGGAIGGAVGGAVGGGLNAVIAGKPSQTLLKVLGLGGLTPVEALTKAGRPSTAEGERYASALQKALPLIKEFPKDQIKSVGDFEDMLHDRANGLWVDTIKPQVDRHASEMLDTIPIRDQVQNSVTRSMKKYFPEEAADIERQAANFGSPISLSEANEDLQAFNAKLQKYYKAAPEARAAILKTDGDVTGLQSAADGLRDAIYSKLEELGEQNPRELRQQYGALKDLERVFGKRATVADRQAPLNLSQVFGTMEAAGALLSGHPLAAVAGAAPWVVKARGSSDSLIRQGIAAAQPGNGAVRRAVGSAIGKVVPNVSAQAGRIYFRASDNTFHSVPNTPDAINQSLSIDPKLTFIAPPQQ